MSVEGETATCTKCGKALRLKKREEPSAERETSQSEADGSESHREAPKRKRKTSTRIREGRKVLFILAASQFLWHVVCVFVVWHMAQHPESIEFEGQAEGVRTAQIALAIYIPATIVCLGLMFAGYGWARYPLVFMAILGFLQAMIIAGRGAVSLGGPYGFSFLIEGLVRAIFNGWTAYVAFQSEALDRYFR